MDSDYIYTLRESDLIGNGGTFPVMVDEVDNRLYRILSEKGITLNKFADSPKMSRTTAKNLLSGKSLLESMPLRDVYWIADYLEMKPEDLFVHKDE